MSDNGAKYVAVSLLVSIIIFLLSASYSLVFR